jgi:hypothetical protein
VHQADRHAEFLVQAQTERKQQGREAGDIRRRRFFPAAVDRGVADLGMGGTGQMLRQHGIAALDIAGDAARHVRLPGTDPYFADEHIVERDRIDCQLAGVAA